MGDIRAFENFMSSIGEENKLLLLNHYFEFDVDTRLILWRYINSTLMRDYPELADEDFSSVDGLLRKMPFSYYPDRNITYKTLCEDIDDMIKEFPDYKDLLTKLYPNKIIEMSGSQKFIPMDEILYQFLDGVFNKGILVNYKLRILIDFSLFTVIPYYYDSHVFSTAMISMDRDFVPFIGSNMIYPLMKNLFLTYISPIDTDPRKMAGKDPIRMFTTRRMFDQIASMFSTNYTLKTPGRICKYLFPGLYASEEPTLKPGFSISTESSELFNSLSMMESYVSESTSSDLDATGVTILFNNRPVVNPVFTEDGVKQTVRHLESVGYETDTDDIRKMCYTKDGMIVGVLEYFDNESHRLYVTPKAVSSPGEKGNRWDAIVYERHIDDICLVDVTNELSGSIWESN